MTEHDPAGLDQLATALAAFQEEAPTVTKDQTARIENRQGETSYTYKYADLADLTRVAYPLLTKHGLAFTCQPRRTETGAYELVGMLLHTSGQRLLGSLPIAGSTAQQVGSSLTYNRRYLFGCMTGLVTDEDDDGARASRPDPQDRGRPAEQLGADDGRPMSSPTRARMFGLFTRKGLTDRDVQVAGIQNIIGRTIESRAELTEVEAQRVIESLKDRPDVPPAQQRPAAGEVPPRDEPDTPLPEGGGQAGDATQGP